MELKLPDQPNGMSQYISFNKKGSGAAVTTTAGGSMLILRMWWAALRSEVEEFLFVI